MRGKRTRQKTARGDSEPEVPEPGKEDRGPAAERERGPGRNSQTELDEPEK